MTSTESAAPVGAAERITNLDTVRGIATLGILVMNAVSFGLPAAAYWNLDAAGSDNWLDWVVGVAGEILVDQKTMALFSLLFGAGVVVFADRAVAKGRRPVRLSLWRFFLLGVVGFVHSLVWDGDVLLIYALCAPLIVAVRNVEPRRLLIAGAATVLSSALIGVLVQPSVPADGAGLQGFWLTGPEDLSDGVGLFLLADFFLRAAGMMLIGVGLFRLGVVQGTRPAEADRRWLRWGLAIGLPLTVAGVVWRFAADFGPEVSVIGEAPNTLATIPLALAYLAAIALWNRRPDTWLHERVRAVGRMALTNYLTQTALGVVVLGVILDEGDLGRAGLAVFVLGVWALQLAWSKPWLDRYRFGPFEWAWRCATYRSWQPLRR